MHGAWLAVSAIVAIALLFCDKKKRVRWADSADTFDVFPGNVARFAVANSRGRPVNL